MARSGWRFRRWRNSAARSPAKIGPFLAIGAVGGLDDAVGVGGGDEVAGLGLGEDPQVCSRRRIGGNVRPLRDQAFEAVYVQKPDLAIYLAPCRGCIQTGRHAVFQQDRDDPVHQIGGDTLSPPGRCDQDHADPAECPIGQRDRRRDQLAVVVAHADRGAICQHIGPVGLNLVPADFGRQQEPASGIRRRQIVKRQPGGIRTIRHGCRRQLVC